MIKSAAFDRVFFSLNKHKLFLEQNVIAKNLCCLVLLLGTGVLLVDLIFILAAVVLVDSVRCIPCRSDFVWSVKQQIRTYRAKHFAEFPSHFRQPSTNKIFIYHW